MRESQELKDRLRQLNRTGPYKVGPLTWYFLNKEAKQIATCGYVDVDFRFNQESSLLSGLYRIDFSPEEAEQWFNAVEQFVDPSSPFETFAEALGPELEALTCGSRPDRYQRVPEQEKPKGFFKRFLERIY